MLATRSRTADTVYECPACGDRLAGERRCPECNLFARCLGEGGCCLACSEVITVNELLDISLPADIETVRPSLYHHKRE